MGLGMRFEQKKVTNMAQNAEVCSVTVCLLFPEKILENRQGQKLLCE